MADGQIKMIKENVRLSLCKQGDEVIIRHRESGHQRCTYWHVILEKVKAIPRNKLQIKYRESATSNVRKLNVPDDLMAERIRPWAEEDGEHRGYYEPSATTRNSVEIAPVAPEITAQPSFSDVVRDMSLASGIGSAPDHFFSVLPIIDKVASTITFRAALNRLTVPYLTPIMANTLLDEIGSISNSTEERFVIDSLALDPLYEEQSFDADGKFKPK
jgi:hypothetical protein